MRIGTWKLNLSVADMFYIQLLPVMSKAAKSLKVFIWGRCVFWVIDMALLISSYIEQESYHSFFLSVRADDLCGFKLYVTPTSLWNIYSFDFYFEDFFSNEGILLPFYTNVSDILHSKYINSFKAVSIAVASLACSYLDDK